VLLLALLCAAVLGAAPNPTASPSRPAPRAAPDPAPPKAPPPPASEESGPPPVAVLRVAPQPTAVRLFAAVEEAWSAADAERLASLIDTTRVRIALKPDEPATTAITRGAAVYLFKDRMHLVSTREFRVLRVEVPDKGPARAQARWVGDWGGRQGVRRLRVHLTAGLSASGWLLTEVRAAD
jgi:hypothetical protein